MSDIKPEEPQPLQLTDQVPENAILNHPRAQVPTQELVSPFGEKVPPGYALSRHGAVYKPLTLEEISITSRRFSPSQQRLLALIPEHGDNKEHLSALAGKSYVTLRNWIQSSEDFRNVFYSLAEMEVKELTDLALLKAKVEAPGAIERVISFARQLRPDKAGKWDKAPTFYSQALAANLKVLALAGVKDGEDKQSVNIGQLLVQIAQSEKPSGPIDQSNVTNPVEVPDQSKVVEGTVVDQEP